MVGRLTMIHAWNRRAPTEAERLVAALASIDYQALTDQSLRGKTSRLIDAARALLDERKEEGGGS